MTFRNGEHFALMKTDAFQARQGVVIQLMIERQELVHFELFGDPSLQPSNLYDSSVTFAAPMRWALLDEQLDNP